MASLKVFVSSTCYDLGVVRSKLQEFLRALGYEPVLSEFSDVLFDPRTHTHTSCVDEVANSDVLVLLVGARFGGKAIPEALSRIDFAKLKPSSSSSWSLDDGRTLSITQIEVLRALELQQPVFAFVDERVMHDHLVYEKNKHKPILSDITFPSIERPDTAQYIFEFINFLRLRNAGNAITTFARIDDIEHHLRKQWSGLFQRLLREDRTRAAETERARHIQQQLDDLKTAILTSIQAPEAREIARGVIRYRSLIDFAASLRLPDKRSTILADDLTWSKLLDAAKVIRIARFDDPGAHHGPWGRVFLLLEDGSYLVMRAHHGLLLEFAVEVSTFSHLQRDVREAILDAWTDSSVRNRGMLTPGRDSFEALLNGLGVPVTVEFFDPKEPGKLLESREFNRAPAKAKTEETEDDDIPF